MSLLKFKGEANTYISQSWFKSNSVSIQQIIRLVRASFYDRVNSLHEQSMNYYLNANSKFSKQFFNLLRIKIKYFKQWFAKLLPDY